MTTFTSNPRITQALHNGVITSEQASLLQSFFNVLDYPHYEKRALLMCSDLYNAMDALGNMTTEKPPEQLQAEFRIRQYKVHQIKNKLLTDSEEPEVDISLLFTKNRLTHDAQLISTAKLNFAIAQVRNALRYSLQPPALLSCQLCNHPYFSLLFRQKKRRQSSDNLVEQLLNNSTPHSELIILADQLKAALPVLAASFENQSGLNEVWLKACLAILKDPLPYALLSNFQSQPFADQVLVSYQQPAAKQLALCAKTDSTWFGLGNLRCRLRSLFSLFVVK